nr:Retrotransposable element Tf2 [Ipomoea batatas]
MRTEMEEMRSEIKGRMDGVEDDWERIDSEHSQLDTLQYSFLDLPLTALGGIDGPKTMKFRGQVAGTEVIIMVDSGASHNFISHRLSSKLQYPLEPTQQFGVKLGDDRRVESKGKYSQLTVNLGSVTMALDCFVFPLGGVDMILGVAWLETLGNIKVNWARMTMTFKVGDRLIQLSGDPSLSRLPVSINALENPNDVDFSCILWEITALPLSNHESREISSSQHSQLRRIVIPATSPWIPKLLEEFHSTPTGGHSGAYRTYRRLAASVYWQGMMRRVQQFVAECLSCQKNKYDTLAPAGLLHPLPIQSATWEDIAMDFITGSNGLDFIWVIIDRFTKYAHFVGLRHPFTAKSLADIFMKEIVRLHGVPRSILCFARRQDIDGESTTSLLPCSAAAIATAGRSPVAFSSVNYSGSAIGINAEYDFYSKMPSPKQQPKPKSPSIEEVEQPNSEEPKPKRAKSTTSDVWKSFTKIGMVDGKEKAKCNGCGKEYIVGGIRYGTSSMLRHIPKCVALPKYHNIGIMMLDAQGKLRSRQST